MTTTARWIRHQGAIEPTWRALLRASDETSPFATPGWMRSFVQCFAVREVVTFLVVEDEESALLALAPFLELRLEDGTRALRVLGNDYTHLSPVLFARDRPDAVVAFAGEIVRRVEAGDADAVLFEHLPTEPTAAVLSRALGERQAFLVERYADESRWVVTKPDGAFDVDEANTVVARPSARRKLRRTRRRLQAAGAIHVAKHVGPAGGEAFLQAYGEVRRRSWKKPDRSRDFMRALPAVLEPPDLFQSYVLTVDGRPAAVQLGFRTGRRYYAYKTAYDQTMSRLAPGVGLLDFVIRDLFSDGVTDVDLLTGKDATKMLWSPSERPQTDLLLIRRDRRLEAATLRQACRRWSGGVPVPGAQASSARGDSP